MSLSLVCGNRILHRLQIMMKAVN